MNKINISINNIRQDFPQLSNLYSGNRLIYLDNASTTQKPKCVIDKTIEAYTMYCANVHRGAYYLSELSNYEYESCRKAVAEFIVAQDVCEIIFVKGVTEAINLVASTYGQANVNFGDEVLVSYMEHHSNIVPWQILCNKVGATLKVIPITKLGELNLKKLRQYLNKKTKIVALAHVSNVLGTINPIKEIIDMVHAQGIKILIDGAQAVSHMSVNMTELDCDFYAFSCHKMNGPTGVGVLYGKKTLLEQMPPYQSGGDMIKTVNFKKTVYAKLPFKFEAGTPNIAGVIGLKAAIKYLQKLDLYEIENYEKELLSFTIEIFGKIPGLFIIGEAKHKSSIISFIVKGIHPHDICTILDHKGISIRAGHLCAQPTVEYFGLSALCRVSLAFYNTKEEIYKCAEAIKQVKKVMHA